MERSARVNTILNCFVDMNLETNERFPYDVQILNVSFVSSYLSVEEGSSVTVTITLSEPSASGFEEVDIVLAHTSTTALDIDQSEFPIHLSWGAGEQEKTFTVSIPRDFLEEYDEVFRLGIANLVNLMPGRFVQTEVLIMDTTDLRTARIIAANANVNTSPRNDPNALNVDDLIDGVSRDSFIFRVAEGEQVNITVGLDSPSQYGVEKVDVSLVGDDSEGYPASVGSNRVEWAIGEQFKTVTITANLDNILQGTRRMTLELANPDSVILDGSDVNRVQIIITDPPITRRYSTINFGRIFKQRGSSLDESAPDYGETEISLRCISDGQITSPRTLYWLTEMGTAYVDENNNNLLSESANYEDWPNYYFGVDALGRAAGIRLEVTNQGTGEVEYNGNTYGVGQTFDVALSRGATSVVLPTNDGLQPAGSVLSQSNMVLMQDTFTESRYRFDIVVDIPQLEILGQNETSGPHGFRLRTTSYLNDTYFIGDFVLPNHATVQASSENSLALLSKYSNMRTRFDSNVCSNTYDGAGRVYNVRVNGLILLSQNSLSSDYISHEIELESSFTPICGSSAGSTVNTSWISIPFEIV